MPVKMIAFILILLIIVAFIGFNVDNKSDIRFGFGEKGVRENIPIYYSFFIMYLVGFLSAIPFFVDWRIRAKRKKADEENEYSYEESPPRRSLFRRKSRERESEDGEDSGD